MIQKETLDFLKDLIVNNNKFWFDANKIRYLTAKDNFLEFGQKLINGISDFDTNIAQACLESKNCIKRINRDVRFSNDKSPYKINFFLLINEGGVRSPRASYYLHLQPGSSFCGGGVYMPLPDDLKKIRNNISKNYDLWLKIVNSPVFLDTFPNGIEAPESLINIPKGYAPQHPASEYLKMKGFFTVRQISDVEIMDINSLASLNVHFRVVKPMIDFLNKSF